MKVLKAFEKKTVRFATRPFRATNSATPKNPFPRALTSVVLLNRAGPQLLVVPEHPPDPERRRQAHPVAEHPHQRYVNGHLRPRVNPLVLVRKRYQNVPEGDTTVRPAPSLRGSPLPVDRDHRDAQEAHGDAPVAHQGNQAAEHVPVDPLPVEELAGGERQRQQAEQQVRDAEAGTG